MDKAKKFEEIVKELQIGKFAQTNQIEYAQKEEVINHVQKVEHEQVEKIAIQNTKTKRWIKRPIIVILIFCILFVSYVFSPLSKVKDIVVVGNKTVDSTQILKIANIKVNDNLTTTYATLIKNRLENNDLIKHAFIKKDLVSQKIYINIKEVQGLFYYENNNTTYLVDVLNKTQPLNEPNINLPKFKDFVNVKESYKQEFIEQLQKIKVSVLNQISEISYAPTKTYLNRFLLKMNDRNYIYLQSSSVAKKLNYYQELRRVLPKNKVVDIYLENADYFKVNDQR